ASKRLHLLPDTLKSTLVAGRIVTEERGWAPYAEAQNLALALAKRYDAALADVDVLVMPTTPMVAPPLPAAEDIGSSSTIIDAIGLDSARNVAPFNVSGHPGLSVPAGLDEQGLPIGLMAVGRQADDAMVLRVGRAVEKHFQLGPAA
ncbi:MAG: amidase family protein, partial [Actinomycetota bacterium]|nr:amidase family protein [Actinomycetota bacterium]